MVRRSQIPHFLMTFNSSHITSTGGGVPGRWKGSESLFARWA